MARIKLEQEPPNRPKFLMVVLLAGATIIAVFLFAYFVLDWDGGGLLPKRHPRHPSSQVVLSTPSSIRRA